MDATPHPQDPADTLLVIRCQLGEPAAFDALIRRWAAPLHRYATRLTQDRDLANDLVQDAWLRVLRGLPRLRDADRFRPWLFGIAHRTFMDHLRQHYRLPTDMHVDLAELPAADADDDPLLMRHDLAKGIDALPLIEREVLSLFHLEEIPMAEIATALDIPLGTVKSRLHRARHLLRQQLTTEGHLP